MADDFWAEEKPETEDEKDLVREFQKALLKAAPKVSTEGKPQLLARSHRYNNGRGYLSDALGVAPDQIAEASEQARKHGVAVDFTPDGRAIITSEKQRRALAKSFGAWNGRDGYNDPKNPTGRQHVERREELKRKIERGEYRHEYDAID